MTVEGTRPAGGPKIEDPKLEKAMAMAVVLCNRPVSGDDAPGAVGEGFMALEAIFEGVIETLSLGVPARDLELFELLLRGRWETPLTAEGFRWAHDFVLRSLMLWQDRGQNPRLGAERFDEVARIYESAGLLQRRPSKRERERLRAEASK